MTEEQLIGKLAVILEKSPSEIVRTPYVTLLRLVVEEHERMLIISDNMFKTIGVDPNGQTT